MFSSRFILESRQLRSQVRRQAATTRPSSKPRFASGPILVPGHKFSQLPAVPWHGGRSHSSAHSPPTPFSTTEVPDQMSPDDLSQAAVLSTAALLAQALNQDRLPSACVCETRAVALSTVPGKKLAGAHSGTQQAHSELEACFCCTVAVTAMAYCELACVLSHLFAVKFMSS